jgi:hypothetical protein
VPDARRHRSGGFPEREVLGDNRGCLVCFSYSAAQPFNDHFSANRNNRLRMASADATKILQCNSQVP